jgi:hypothetical protein
MMMMLLLLILDRVSRQKIIVSCVFVLLDHVVIVGILDSDEEYKAEQKTNHKATNVSEIVDMRHQAKHEIDQHEQQERNDRRTLFLIPRPVGEKLGKSGTQKPEQCTRRAHRDLILDEKRRQKTTPESRQKVYGSNPKSSEIDLETNPDDEERYDVDQDMENSRMQPDASQETPSLVMLAKDQATF